MFRIVPQKIYHDDEWRLLLFYKFLPIIIVTTLIIAFGIVVYNSYHNKNIESNQKIGDILAGAILSGDEKEITNITKKFNKIREHELFLIRDVSMKMKKEKNDDIFLLMKKIVNDEAYSDITRSYMRLMIASLVLDISSPPVDQIEFAKDCLSYFSEKNSNKKKEFFGIAMLLTSLVYNKAGDQKLSRETAEKILADQNVSYNIKENAKVILAID